MARQASTLTAAVVLVSAGRPGLLADVLHDLSKQTHGDFIRLISVPDRHSLPADVRGWVVVTGARGAAAQRNAGLEALPDVDVVFFFDDDAVVRPDYVENALEFLAAHPAVVGLTGQVLLDGATRGEVALTHAQTLLRDSDRRPSGRWRRTRQLYGCNFAFRTAAAPRPAFDARLPLYSWLEDHDFARRLMPSGPLAMVEDCVIVHRAAASGGRTQHVRLGYSQVMNPIYLKVKGSFPLWLMLYELGRPVLKNLLRAAAGRESVWRRRRLHGNALALRDVLAGRITPERITML